MGRYVVEARLGVGGMAEVYRARLIGAEGFSRAVALKRVAPALSEDASFGAMFIGEARIAALLNHPNIVSVLDFDRDEEGVLFLAMELVDGPDLRKLTDAAEERGVAIGPGLAVFLCGEVLRGLAYAHELKLDERPLGIIHRDVSPHNVLVSRSGTVKLADFGIAKATAAATTSRSGTVKGKLAYMAPEQALGETLDGRADVYAVGIMLYELLAGERPYHGGTEAETLAKLLRGEAAPLARRAAGVPPDLAAVTMRFFAARAKDCPGSAAEALQALRATSAYPADGEAELSRLVKSLFPASTPANAGPPRGVPVTVQGKGLAKRDQGTKVTATTFRPSKRSLAILAGLAMVSVAVAAAVWLLPGRSGPPPRAERAAASQPAPAVSTPDGPVAITPADGPGTAEASADAAVVVAADEPPKHEKRDRRDREKAPEKPMPASESPREGTLTVRAQSWALVEVDGDSWGQTPITRRKISGGRHRVIVTNDAQGKREVKAIDVRSGENEVVTVDW